MTLQEPAPPELLKLISCQCEKGCEKGCGCRTAGLKCSDICFHCRGRACTNAKETELNNSDCDDDDDDIERDQWNLQSNKLGQPVDQYLDSSDDESQQSNRDSRPASAAGESSNAPESDHENEETNGFDEPSTSYNTRSKRRKLA